MAGYKFAKAAVVWKNDTQWSEFHYSAVRLGHSFGLIKDAVRRFAHCVAPKEFVPLKAVKSRMTPEVIIVNKTSWNEAMGLMVTQWTIKTQSAIIKRIFENDIIVFNKIKWKVSNKWIEDLWYFMRLLSFQSSNPVILAVNWTGRETSINLDTDEEPTTEEQLVKMFKDLPPSPNEINWLDSNSGISKDGKTAIFKTLVPAPKNDLNVPEKIEKIWCGNDSSSMILVWKRGVTNRQSENVEVKVFGESPLRPMYAEYVKRREDEKKTEKKEEFHSPLRDDFRALAEEEGE